MRPVVTASDLDRIAVGGEIGIAADALITPLARDEAARRGISFRIVEDTKGNPIPGATIVPKAAAGAGMDSQGRKIVAIAADHGGYEMKEKLEEYLKDWGYAVQDLGTKNTEAVDYPDFAAAAAEAVASGRAWRGVVLDSAGIGSAIAANKVPGARAALCYDRATARNSREHNDANILTVGAKLIPLEVAREILAVWLETPFGGGRHARRVEKIRAIEAKYSAGKKPGAAS
ncbi:MAG TPA: ribose 5-phosphate isomerase B [Candidatus Acidoferrales bacterium]|nr:ribose 5-phosphate isomerase B [Candidatus Acidoferrales bacterium]